MKRRNVYRVGIAYIVAGWAIVQLGYVTAADMGAPPWVMGLVVTFVVAGFPIAMFFAWTFAWTRQGIRKETDVNENPQLIRRSGRKLDYVTMALLATVMGVMFFDKYLPQPPGSEIVTQSPQPAVAQEPLRPIVENSIAVLPFVNMSAEANQDYFSDGLSEELLNVLTKVDGLFVASRTSSFAFKGHEQSIHDIAQTLRVANILEGSVRKVGDRLRITAQLIDADTDVHLWSDSYDRDMTDIFQIQDEIANAIVSALTTELGVGGLEAVNVITATSSIDAYDLYLKAREMFIARENLPTSWKLLEQAVHTDPDFSRAWETLSAVHSVATSWFPGDGIDHESLALAAAHKSLELDPDLSMAHAVIGMKHQITGEGYAGAINSLNQAIENDPNNGTAWLWRGITFFDMGYAEKALRDFEQCIEVDPGYLNCLQYEALALMNLGQIEAGVRKFEATLEANFHSTDDTFVSYYVHTGQRAMALAIAALAMRDQFAPIKYWIEAIENPDEDHSARVAYFNQWGAAHNITVCDMDSLAIALRQDQCLPTVENATQLWLADTAYFRKKPAFKEFVNTHLLAYWQENGFPPQCRALDDGDFECD
jgi:TolB-like protein/tetratricopeptide (TPR) repeat protein